MASDTAFENNVPDRKNSQNFLIKLFGTPIFWKLGKQTTITTSTMEAELLSLSANASELYSL